MKDGYTTTTGKLESPTPVEKRRDHVHSHCYLDHFCSVTEESSWDPPEEGFNPPPEAGEGTDAETVEQTAEVQEEGQEASNLAWVAYKDDEGREYYYNTVTNETQWEEPDGFIAQGEGGDLEAQGSPQDEVTELEPLSSEKTTKAASIESPNHYMGESKSLNEPEEEEIDPAVKRVQEAELSLSRPDSILEPACMKNVTELVTSEGGNPQKAITALIDSYQGQTAICGLLARWLTDMRTTLNSESAGPSEAVADEIRDLAEDVVSKIAKERFSKETGDSILDLSKSEAAFLEEMMDSSRWRRLLIELSATHKDSAVLVYCLRAISKRGHHREIAKRINQSEHFVVFNAMLLSEISVIGKLALSAGCDTAGAVALQEVLDDLRRACSSTSYTYLYSVELLRYLDGKMRQQLLSSNSDRLSRALRKWEALRQDLENAMIDPSASSSIAGSSPLFRKRRLEVALTISELHQRHRRRRIVGDHFERDSEPSSASLETYLLAFLRKHTLGIQIDDSVLDPLLPQGLDLNSDAVGDLLVQHPLAIRALLGCLYRSGVTRAASPVVKNKCARLVAIAVLAAERTCLLELGEDAIPQSDEVALTSRIVEGCQLCEQLETMVSFLVTTASESEPVVAPGQKLCSIALRHAVVAQGVVLWAKELTCPPEFASSASFPTLSVSILSLVRVLALEHPFARKEVLDITAAFLKHSNSDISYQKVSAIKEQALRLMLFLLAEGEVTLVLGSLASRLRQQGTSELDASLIRYFVAGMLEIVRPPVSFVFVRSLDNLLRTPKCLDACRSAYFVEPHRERLVKLLKSFQIIKARGAKPISSEDAALVASLLAAYQIEDSL